MDKCSKKDCVDFDVSKEDMDLTGNCNICNHNRRNPTWVASDDQYLQMKGDIVNPTDDVPLNPIKEMDEAIIKPVVAAMERFSDSYPALPWSEAEEDTEDERTFEQKIQQVYEEGLEPTEDFVDVLVQKGTFTPIPVMADRREKVKEFVALTNDPAHCTFQPVEEAADMTINSEVAKIFTPYVEETAEISEEVFDALKPGPLSAGFSPNGNLLKECEAEKDIKDSGKRTEFETGAVRDAQGGKGRFDLLPWLAIWALAHHTEKGCVKYGDRNWEKGIPVKNYIDSGLRHLVEAILGLQDENHLAAALWNIACAYETKVRIDMGILPESLDEDIPYILKGVIDSSEMVMPWDRLRHPRMRV